MAKSFMSAEGKAKREADLEKMRERFRQRHVIEKRKGGKSKDKVRKPHVRKIHAKRPEALTFAELAYACAKARTIVKGLKLKAALAECEGYFRELAEETFAPEELTTTWRQTSGNSFAVRSDGLQMTEDGLRVAMHQIPKDARRDLSTFRWKRRFKDGNGEQWLEFECAG